MIPPAKERSGGGFGHGDDDKFSGNWRRDGPLPDAPGRDGGNRRRYEGLGSEATRESVAEGNADWRSNRPARILPEADVPPVRRRGSGFSTPSHEGGELSPADNDAKWTIGGKFKTGSPAAEGQSGGRFGSVRGRGDMGPPPAPSVADESDWRRPKPARNSSSRKSRLPKVSGLNLMTDSYSHELSPAYSSDGPKEARSSPSLDERIFSAYPSFFSEVRWLFLLHF